MDRDRSSSVADGGGAGRYCFRRSVRARHRRGVPVQYRFDRGGQLALIADELPSSQPGMTLTVTRSSWRVMLATLVPYVFCRWLRFLSGRLKRAVRLAQHRRRDRRSACVRLFAGMQSPWPGRKAVLLGFLDLVLVAGLPVYVWVARRTARRRPQAIREQPPGARFGSRGGQRLSSTARAFGDQTRSLARVAPVHLHRRPGFFVVAVERLRRVRGAAGYRARKSFRCLPMQPADTGPRLHLRP